MNKSIKERVAATAKARLRKECVARLEELSASDLLNAARLIHAEIEGMPEFFGAELVALYVAKDWEIDLLSRMAVGNGVAPKVVLPRWNSGGGHYEFALLNDRCHLVAGRYGILEPDENSLAVDPKTIDLALVPGLAFSSAGDRLGRGRGFYDRLLRPLNGKRLGICHDFQLVELVPNEVWDERVDGVVTPRGYVEAEPDVK